MYKEKSLLVVLALALLSAIGCGSVSGNGSSPTPTPTPVAGNPTPTPGNPTPTPTPTAGSTLVFVGSGITSGISEFKLNADGSLTQIPTTAGIPSSDFTALAQSGTSLLGAQIDSAGSVQVTLYSVNGQTGALTVKSNISFLAPTPTSPTGTLTATMNDSFAYIGTANGIYAFSLAGGNLAAVPGSPFQTGSPADEFQLANFTFLKTNGSFLMAAHGSNTLITALQIAADGSLTVRNDSKNAASFSGMALSPSGTQVYGSSFGHLTTFPFNPGNATFGALVDTTTGNNAQGAFDGRIALSPSGKFLYQNFKEQGDINVYSVNQQTGTTTFVSQARGEDFGTGVAVDPSGKFLVGTFGDDTGEHLLVFSLNATTGAATVLANNTRRDVGSTTAPTDIIIADF